VSLSNIIIVDSFEDRAKTIEVLAARHAKSVEIILMNVLKEEDIATAQTQFRERLGQLLSAGKSVMVVFDGRTALKGKIVKILREVEREHNEETRRIMVDCRSCRPLQRMFKKTGTRRDGIRHIVYNGDQSGKYIGKFRDLFRL
jgi:hypothetical protein